MLRSQFSVWVERLWYGRHPLRFLLSPFSWIFQIVSRIRRLWLEWRQIVLPVPVIVVGNLSVGGVGKTPLVIALAHYLSQKGLRVGIVSRGYGAHTRHFPHEVRAEDDARTVGDEPKLLAIKTACPVVIAPKRLEAVAYLLEHHQSQVIISDDGLQHYALPRALEIVVIDGMRGMGSGLCLPAGPLRESVKRLQEVNFIVVNGEQSVHTQALKHKEVYPMTLQAELPRTVTGKVVAWQDIAMPCSAVAGIGHPERFFTLLKQLGVIFQPHKFADHHEFLPHELTDLKPPVIMTEKDAVKCCSFATEAMYYLPVEAKLSDEFWTKIWAHIRGFI
jgi:tetraacyldisaccharide 4'-kinase